LICVRNLKEINNNILYAELKAITFEDLEESETITGEIKSSSSDSDSSDDYP